MRILLDHCVPRPLGRHLTGHEAIHTSRLKWGGLQNGKLLSAAEQEGFSALITVDRSMRFQQNMAGRKLAVVSIRVPRNDIGTLVAMVSAIQEALSQIEPGRVITPVHPEMP